jgi:AAA15 family ATPase/GTPase
MVFESHIHNENTVFRFQPFKFEGYKNKPSTFLIRFVSNNTFATGDSTTTVKDTIEQAIQVFTYHKESPKIPFDLGSEESDGTRKLFNILLSLLNIVKNNKALIIDEIESSLHTNIVEFIIKLFHAGSSSQLIYSTHNTNLLNLNKLRKDQIYFVNKKGNGSTELYSLFDFKDFRETMDVEKAYLQGRFDAIPIIDDSDLNLKSLIHG